jgi:CheY-like chemotaxis protein
MAPRRTILIADDEPAFRRLIRVMLASDQYLVIEAHDGDDAWTLMQTVRPAVALLDIKMPGRDGLALTRAIRADPHLAATRVILLTGLLGMDVIAEGCAAGADHYLTKPFSPLELVATIEACLGATG